MTLLSAFYFEAVRVDLCAYLAGHCHVIGWDKRPCGLTADAGRLQPGLLVTSSVRSAAACRPMPVFHPGNRCAHSRRESAACIRCRRGHQCSRSGPQVDTKRCACSTDLKRCSIRARLRVEWGAFSARLFKERRCRWSTRGRRSCVAAPYLARVAGLRTRGMSVPPFNPVRTNVLAACGLRRRCTSLSSTVPA